jgi:dephospho-CoA kinase
MSTIIALTGPKGSGKDTVAQTIVDIAGELFDVKTIAFADPIKQVVQHIFQLDTSSVEEYDTLKRSELSWNSTFKVSGRHVVREIGMLMRSYNEDQFTNYVEQEIMNSNEAWNVWVVTDLRFNNEYTLMKKFSAKIVKVTRPGYNYDGHVTEQGFNDSFVDYIIENNGSFEDLRIKTQETLKRIMKR